MSLNFSAANRATAALLSLLITFALTSCSTTGKGEAGSVTVSNPAMAYFVSRLVPPGTQVNVMIPQGADHDTYTPRPSQMAALAQSTAYIAYGPLEFEITWKDRILSTAPGIKWMEVSANIDLIAGHDHDHGQAHDHDADSHSASADPHFWLSPRQAAIMSRNVANALKTAMPTSAAQIDSALVPLLADVAAADSALSDVAREKAGETFVVYHPALAYVARDYGFRQLTIGSEGVAPSARQLALLADSARRSGAQVFFLQPGMAPDRVENLAAEMNTRLVTLQPEQQDWPATMRTITQALQ